MIIILILDIIVHVLLVEDQPLPLLWVLTITVNQELSTVLINQPITLMTHCGMDRIATVVPTVALTLPYHGSTEN